MRDQLEKTIETHPFDPDSSEWPRVSIASNSARCGDSNDAGNDDDKGVGLSLEIPRMDLFANIPADCAAKMVRSKHH